MEELKDKKLYSYKQALSQPYWIQQIADNFSFPTAVKLSWLVYLGATFLLLYNLSRVLLFFLPLPPRVMLSGVAAFFLAGTLSSLTVDGKAVAFYVKDYLIFWWKYGRKSKGIYINKGKVYTKPIYLIVKEKGEK